MSASPPDHTARSRSIYRRLLGYAWQHWGIFAVSILCMIIVAAMAASFAALMKPMMDDGFVKQDEATIAWLPFAVIGIYLVRAIATIISVYGVSWIGRNIIHQLRRQMFSTMLALPKTFFDRATTGEIIAKYTFDVEQVANAATKAITIMVRDGFTAIALIAWMFYLNALLALTFVVLGPLIAVLVVYASRRIRRISKRIQGSMGDISRVLEESVKAQLVVKIFGGQQYENQQFEQVNEHNRRQNMKLLMTAAINTPVVQLLVAIALAIIISVATSPALRDQVSVGIFMSFLTSMFMLFTPIRSLTTINVEIQRGITAAESVFRFIDQHQENDTGTYVTEDVKGRIEFDHVTFRYAAGADDVLQDIDLTIEPGQTVAFVGRSGSGKSTLINLLPRMYDLVEGDVRLDGVSINDYSLANLRSHYAYVGQDVVLFNDTIEHNIAYGALDDFNREQILAATDKAYATGFIQETAHGFDTEVGERGVMLSGGQRQRIAIARAILKDAPVLILDEATSALDNESERHIQESLHELMQGRTTLVIAHRLSTIENADLIVVMDKGRIVETGTHTALLAQDGHYARLHNRQFQEEEANDD